MAEVVAVVGAVSGTVVIINTVKTWVGELRAFLEEYKKVGETLQKVEVSLISLGAKLSVWMQLWRLQKVRGSLQNPSLPRSAMIGGITCAVSRLRKDEQKCEKNVIVHTRSHLKSYDRQTAE